MTNMSISLFKFKKIEQGQLLYPKICPLMFSKIFSYMGGHKHLIKGKNKFFEDKQVLSIGMNKVSFNWHFDKLRLGA